MPVLTAETIKAQALSLGFDICGICRPEAYPELGFLAEAMRIRKLARHASDLVFDIDQNTRAVWALRDTHTTAESLLQGARAIDGNAAAIVEAVSGAGDAKTAA